MKIIDADERLAEPRGVKVLVIGQYVTRSEAEASIARIHTSGAMPDAFVGST